MDLALNLVVGNVLAGVIARPLEHSYVVMAPLHQPETPGAEQSNNLPGLFISVGRKALVAGRFVADGALALLLGKQVAPLRRSHSFVHWHCKFLPWLTDCWKWAMVGNEAYRLDHQRNIVVEMPQPRVAVVTEKRTKFPGNVVVVGMQSPVLGASTRKSSADSTSAALHGKDRFVLVAIAAQPVVLVEQEVHSVGSMSRVFPPIVASLLRAGLAAIAEAIWFPLMLRKVGPRYRRLTERAYLFIGAACRTLWARDQVGTDFLLKISALHQRQVTKPHRRPVFLVLALLHLVAASRWQVLHVKSRPPTFPACFGKSSTVWHFWHREQIGPVCGHTGH
jgi:hypothetical protein